MFRLSNIRIGTKLAVMSGLGILLVVGMIVSQMMGNSSVKSATDMAMMQEQISRSVMATKASERGMQTAVRDIRLARTNADLQIAVQNLEQRQKDAHTWADPLVQQLRVPENRARMEKLIALVDDYAAGAKQIAAIRTQIIELDARGGSEAARMAELDQQAVRFARERTLPIAAEMEKLIDETDQIAHKLAEEETEKAAHTLTSAERIGLGIGLLTALVLIGSALLGAFSIARPLAKMAGVLNELTNDRIVDVPYTDRGDEVGDIAKATEIFRESIAEKMINLRVRAGLDVVRSNVMIADDLYNIMYMNGSLTSMMREAEAELRKVLPQFDSNKLVGSNIDIFHKNPAHQRRILDGLSGSYETHITVGTQRFDLVATSVMDRHGKRAGTVVEWRNVTAEKEIEAEIDDIVQAAVAGDFGRRVPTEGKKGFMLNLATAMNGLCENIAAALDDLLRVLSAMADGDLTQRITGDYQGAFGKLKSDTNAMAEQLGATINEIKQSAREVTNAAAEISTSTTDLSQRTEEQAASLEETSASMEEMSATVKKNAENAQQANLSASGTRDVADRGGQVVAKAVDAMARIEESSRKISDIIGVIDEIARQTNLLALNAAVEAARAGEAGRGFAVVASEVRSLAQRSSQAAKDIKDLITSSNGQVKDGVDLVNKAGGALTEIVESIKKVAEVVSDIAAASAEQATGLEQVNKALAQMDEVTQQNSALVEENAATAKTLEHQAAAMNERVSSFRIPEAAEFGHTARAAESPAPRAAAPVVSPVAPKRPAAPAKRVVKGANGGGPVGRMQAALATAVKQDPDWQEF